MTSEFEIIRSESLADLWSAALAWEPGDWSAILAMPLAELATLDLSSELSAASRSYLKQIVTAGWATRPLVELLHNDDPPVLALTAIKELFKTHRTLEKSAVSRPVATLLYYVAILLAKYRRHERISSLTDAQVEEGIAWSLQQEWIDAATRRVIVACQARQ